MNQTRKKQVVIIGAGPAGLSAAYEILSKDPKNYQVTLIDKNDVVGGLARSYNFHNHYFDVGPHRFYTKNQEVLDLWKKILGKDLIKVNRLTRMLYKKKLFLYPVQLKDILVKIGPLESFEIFVSYIYAKIFLRNLKTITFEDWVTKNFGSKLFNVFFKSYTEKVWGIKCDQIAAQWASQRIKNLDLFAIIKNSLLGNRFNKTRSLVEEFYYPTEGAGLLYQRLKKEVEKAGGKVILNSEVTKINHNSNKIESIEYVQNGEIQRKGIEYLFSSMPLTQFISGLKPDVDKKILAANSKLFYRDHITVNLLINSNKLFPDNWIYVHVPEVKMARITNYNSFSSHNSSDQKTGISVEYFVFKGDNIWNLSDGELTQLAISELKKVGLLGDEKITDSFIIRETESYPTYYINHEADFNILKDFVSNFKNLQLIGRGGMYKYNNQDHAIYSGLLAARNFLADKQLYDVWSINEDADYLEIIATLRVD